MSPTKPSVADAPPAAKCFGCVSCLGLTILAIYCFFGILSSAVNSLPTKSDVVKEAKIDKQKAARYKADMKTFISKIGEIKGGSTVVKSVERDQFGNLRITVANAWHYEPYQIRLQLAQQLWHLWAHIHSPKEPDAAKIAIVDGNGNRVGGSSAFAASVVSVEND